MEDEGVDSEDADVGESEGENGDSDVEEDLQLEMEDSRAKADEMGVEHLATLERLRQNQRQDYLKVSDLFISVISVISIESFSLGFCVRFSSSNRSSNERITGYLQE